MAVVQCIGISKNPDGLSPTYILANEEGKTITIREEDLKWWMGRSMEVVNLTLTKDNRIVRKRINKPSVNRKHYKSFAKEYIGGSDYATLIFVGPTRTKFLAYPLSFGEDGTYTAYIVHGEAEIGSHYKKEVEFTSWLRIYDDDGLVKKFEAKKIIVYTAGRLGCIIQLLD